jgi:hypothetical protein
MNETNRKIIGGNRKAKLLTEAEQSVRKHLSFYFINLAFDFQSFRKYIFRKMNNRNYCFYPSNLEV